MPKEYKLVCWDCDDTLVNSEVIAMGVAIRILADETERQKPDIQIDRPHFVREYAGWHYDKMIDSFEEMYQISIDRDRISEDKIKSTLEGLREVKAIEHVSDAISTLSSKYDQILVTSSEFDRVNLCLEVTGLDVHFIQENRFSASDSISPARHKPDPAIVDHALQTKSVDYKDAVAIEDSPSGVKAWVNRDMDVIAFVATARVQDHERGELADKLLAAGAKIAVSDARDIPAAISLLETGLTPSSWHGKVWKPETDSFAVLQNPGFSTPPGP